jgi:hypothetical protein
MVHLYVALKLWVEFAGLEVALGEPLSEWGVSMKANDMTVHYCGLRNATHLATLNL